MRRKLLYFQQMLATRKCGSPTIVAENGHSDLGQCGGGLDEEKKWCSLGHRRTKSTSNMKLYVGRRLLDHTTQERKCGADATRSYRRSKQTGPGTQAGKSVVDKYV